MKGFEHFDIRRWVVGDDASAEFIDALALVDKPAIKKQAVLFNEEVATNRMSDEEIELYNLLLEEEDTFEIPAGDIFVGPIMVPNKLIYREDADGNGYYGYWNREAVYNAFLSFMKNENNNDLNLQHNSMNSAEGVYLLEAYLVRDEKQADYLTEKYGIEAKVGEVWAAYRVENEEIKRQIESGEITGYSIEILQREVDA